MGRDDRNRKSMTRYPVSRTNKIPGADPASSVRMLSACGMHRQAFAASAAQPGPGPGPVGRRHHPWPAVVAGMPCWAPCRLWGWAGTLPARTCGRGSATGPTGPRPAGSSWMCRPVAPPSCAGSWPGGRARSERWPSTPRPRARRGWPWSSAWSTAAWPSPWPGGSRPGANPVPGCRTSATCGTPWVRSCPRTGPCACSATGVCRASACGRPSVARAGIPTCATTAT